MYNSICNKPSMINYHCARNAFKKSRYKIRIEMRPCCGRSEGPPHQRIGSRACARTHKKSQDHVKILGFHRPSHIRPILIPGIRICSQKWSQVNISIGYSYISQVKILYKVKFSKLEISQFDGRLKIYGKNNQRKCLF